MSTLGKWYQAESPSDEARDESRAKLQSGRGADGEATVLAGMRKGSWLKRELFLGLSGEGADLTVQRGRQSGTDPARV